MNDETRDKMPDATNESAQKTNAGNAGDEAMLALLVSMRLGTTEGDSATAARVRDEIIASERRVARNVLAFVDKLRADLETHRFG